MKMLIQKYFSFFICIFLYFTSLENAFCYGGEGNDFNSITTLFGGNKYFMTRESHLINQSYHNKNSKDSAIFNVLNFGAKGDGRTNDRAAFSKAWNAACKVKGGVLLVPSGFTFLLQPILFSGSNCQPNVVVQVDGNINAPSKKSDWDRVDYQWIAFLQVKNGITIRGKGVINGFGQSWWADVKDANKVTRPHAIRIASSANVIVTGITITNSPFFHILFDGCQVVRVLNIATSSPGDSPNTDGIHLTSVQHALIYNCTITSGDDCVSIQSGCSDVKIQNTHCDPGHGYSIGGLGPPSMPQAEVKDIIVVNSVVQNSLTGVRIKTWPGGIGSVTNITFTNITMSNVKTAISIDQSYCGGPKDCPEPNKNAVAISDIMYEGITGTYSKRSVSLVCSKYKVCRRLRIGNINLTPSNSSVPGGYDGTFCTNAYGKLLSKTTPPLDRCVLPDQQAPPEVLAPAAAPALVAV